MFAKSICECVCSAPRLLINCVMIWTWYNRLNKKDKLAWVANKWLCAISNVMLIKTGYKKLKNKAVSNFKIMYALLCDVCIAMWCMRCYVVLSNTYSNCLSCMCCYVVLINILYSSFFNKEQLCMRCYVVLSNMYSNCLSCMCCYVVLSNIF